MSTLAIAQASKLAKTLGMEGEGTELMAVLKATAFKGQVSDAQMAALLLVANQYGLSPWTKEIYAFPDRQNGIVPVVGVDGWARIINAHPQFDGMDFEQDENRCTCIIYRKDRSHPIRVTEFMEECRRENVGPWKSHPRRMLRHKAMIQCARLAFGYAGIYDADEAERIIEATSIDAETGEIKRTAAPARPELGPYPDDKFQANLPQWRSLVQTGKKRAEEIVASLNSKAKLTDEQRRIILDLDVIDVQAGPAATASPAKQQIPIVDADFLREYEGGAA